MWSVAANRDQLEKHGLWSDEWVPSARIPNRVQRRFLRLEDAAALYKRLQELRLVAFRNWLS